MLVLGHTGITLAVAVLLSGATTVIRFPETKPYKSKGISPEPSPPAPATNVPRDYGDSWLTSLAGHIDIRLLFLASLLPDIIDKPLGHLFFRETLSSGRTIGHTLFFLILITLAGIYLYRSRNKTWLLVVSLGVLVHLILDQMWQTPGTLLWPLLGFSFERQDITDWLPNLLNELLTKPGVYIPELVGLLVIIWFTWEVWRRRKLLSFIKYGRI
jgi:membrane-bound metal-dependent hydrolase YbcI (DUF457 family)